MKDYLIPLSFSAVMFVSGLCNYCFVYLPEQRALETQRQALLAIVQGDRAEAAVILSGEANARFSVLAQELDE